MPKEILLVKSPKAPKIEVTSTWQGEHSPQVKLMHKLAKTKLAL
jgi:hypothetical protein